MATVTRCCLTLSNFGGAIKHNTKYEKLVESILYKPPLSTLKALESGKSHENKARSCYINEKMMTHSNSYKVVTTYIHICVSKPWLAAFPGSLVEDPSEPPE